MKRLWPATLPYPEAVTDRYRHGYGVLLRLQQMTGHALTIEQGALYPALYRLERQKLVETEWGTSENNRRAKFYRLTPAGRKRLRAETKSSVRPGLGRARACGRRSTVDS